MIHVFGLVLLGYFAGAIPFGVILANLRGVDIREHGSGNIGATNVTRVLGARLGAVVLVLDAAKGALPVWFAIQQTGAPGTVCLVGWAAILGHCFSPFLGFSGGKGVATATGVFLMLSPRDVAIAVGVFLVVLAWKRVPALGSLAAVAAFCLITLARGHTEFAVLAVATLLLLVYTHRTNLAKLTRP
ncbi:MAG: glycerol-3-phosphate 1-O-acyltransferase PlsY [Myxococcales bacterium]|nr:glycerol-3-phosphate 1-O-acyltransferase PlsY [Myxococcales bacterium]